MKFPCFQQVLPVAPVCLNAGTVTVSTRVGSATCTLTVRGPSQTKTTVVSGFFYRWLNNGNLNLYNYTLY